MTMHVFRLPARFTAVLDALRRLEVEYYGPPRISTAVWCSCASQIISPTSFAHLAAASLFIFAILLIVIAVDGPGEVRARRHLPTKVKAAASASAGNGQEAT